MGNAAGFIITLVLLGGAFWLLIVRPRQRQMAAHSQLMNQLAVGDEVMTTSGIYGTVEAIEDNVVHIEIAPDVTIRVVRGAIARITSSAGPAEQDPS
jgi:preprotein translocase subunit YajC